MGVPTLSNGTDTALHHAREQGRNACRFYADGMNG